MHKFLLSILLLLQCAAPAASTTKEIDCLTRNVYYEAKSESRKGKLAVALVTLNRVADKRYPKSICSVVYQKHQFSWTNHYKREKINVDQWLASQDAALAALSNRNILGSFRATHFHNDTVAPAWGLRKIAKIGGHTFYM